MKANRALQTDTEAVSPVVGVILMVAITVVLAATVFVVVGQMGKKTAQAPSIQFLIDSRTGKISIVRADAGVDISNLQVQMSVAGRFNYNAQATSTAGTALTPNTYAPLSASTGTTMTGGDYISFCANTAGSGITVSVRYTPANQMLYTNSFTTLAACT
jgi:flagellin-like protein